MISFYLKLDFFKSTGKIWGKIQSIECINVSVKHLFSIPHDQEKSYST